MIFYTYIHRRETDGRVFYVGKGQGRRAHRFGRRNSHWRSSAAKHGVSVEIIAHWPTELEAFEHERLLIACFRDMGHPLTNKTDGGEGASGHIASEVQRQLNAQAQRRPEVVEKKANATRTRFRDDPEFAAFNRARKIEALSAPEVRARMSASARVKTFTPKHREAMSAARMGNRNKQPTPVLLLDHGITFRAIVDAIEWLREGGFMRADAGSISKTCKGRILTHHGFRWGYA